MKYFYIILLLPTLLWSQSGFEQSETFYKKEQYSLAKCSLENVLKQNPDNLKTLQYLGEIACHYKSWDRALFYFERLVKLKPANADYYYLYGGALALKAKSSNKLKALGMLDDIQESFEKAIKLNPKHVEARWALIDYYLEVPSILGGSENKAARYASELFQISRVDGYLSKAHIAEKVGRYKDSEKYYLKAIEEEQSVIAYKKLAFLYKDKMKMPEKSKTMMETYYRKKGNS